MAKRCLFISVIGGWLLWLSLLPGPLAAQETKYIKKGAVFPETSLNPLASAKDRAYLGLAANDRFTIKDLKAEVILVDIFDVYCIPCQKQAPFYNELYGMIQSNPKTRDRIKMIAVAEGNQDDEIKKFRDHFKVPYPIASDPEYALNKAVGGPPAPFTIIVQKSPDKLTVAATHLGINKDMKGLFKELQSLLGTAGPQPKKAHP